MKIQKKFVAAGAALLIMLNCFPASALDTKALPEKTDIATPDEAPAFYAKIEYSFQGYIVKGTFTEFTPDTSLVQPLYSLDGENYQACGENWDLRQLGTEDEDTLAKLQNQICLYSNYEPLKSYLAEKLDCFYLKLRITRENGITYETQPAVIDRGIPQSIPEGLSPCAMFSPAMAVIETRPFSYYGRYQITIRENTTAEEISAYLPDTLPVKIDLQTKKDHFASGIVNCPVTWKPLSLPQLTAGESVTIANAAEEIVVPAGTLVTTPMGIFQLDEPLGINQYSLTDEVKLVLNVISEGENPTGVLSEENTGLEMSFHLKPTGATAIRAYTFSEGDSKWIEIPNLPLLEGVNAQPSAKNSGYTLVLHNTSEAYRSYLEAQSAGDKPTSFFVGVKIEGGVYNGKQLILPWPDTYESPVKLPDIGGAGGNHNNAGTSNKDDSTKSGQRPNLPPTQENKPKTTATPDNTKHEQRWNLPQNPTQSYTPFIQFPTVAQFPAGTNTEDKTGDSTVNMKTSSWAELTATASPQPEAKISDALISSNKEEKTDRWKIPDRTTESKHHEQILSVAVMAAASLCIAGIYFATTSGKITRKNILRKFILRK